MIPGETQTALYCLGAFCIVACALFHKDTRAKNALIIAAACASSILLGWLIDSWIPLGETAAEANAMAFFYHFCCFGLCILAGLTVSLFTENVKAVLSIYAASLLHVYSLFTLFMGVIPSNESVYTAFIIAINVVIGLTMLCHGSFDIRSVLKSFFSSVRSVFGFGHVAYAGKKSTQEGK